MITRKRLNELLYYNGRNFYWRFDGNNQFIKQGERAGSVTQDGVAIKLDGKLYKEHRLVWFLMFDEWPSKFINHLDGDKTNNNWENLHEITNASIMDKLTVRKVFDYREGNLYWKETRGRLAVKGEKAGTLNGAGYYQVVVDQKRYFLHHLIWIYHFGYKPEMLDHINGDKADNRIENLRECDKSTNAMNSKISSRNTSGIKGVGWNKQHSKWRARLKVNGKDKHIGFFSDLKDAEKAIIKAREKYHANFCRHK